MRRSGARGPLLVAILIAAGSAAAVPATHRDVRQVMGTLASVEIWAEDASVAAAAADSVFVTWVAVDSLLSSWNGNSAVGRLNRAAAGEWQPVGRSAATVLAAARLVAERTDGAFDPTVLPLVQLWGFRGGTATIPAADTLAAIRARVGYSALETDPTVGRARLRLPGMAIDLGGIAKGYALDQAIVAARAAGAVGGVLDLGGNLVVFGDGPGAEVGVVDPVDPTRLVCTLPLESGAVATSGQYEQTVRIGDKTFGHILDPRTGYPVPPGVAVTVLAREALWADALATAAVVLGAEAGLALLESWPGVEGLVAGPDGLAATSGLESVTD